VLAKVVVHNLGLQVSRTVGVGLQDEVWCRSETGRDAFGTISGPSLGRALRMSRGGFRGHALTVVSEKNLAIAAQFDCDSGGGAHTAVASRDRNSFCRGLAATPTLPSGRQLAWFAE
jgi:hypothetical protein